MNQTITDSIRWVLANDDPKRTHLDQKRSIHVKQVDFSDTNVCLADKRQRMDVFDFKGDNSQRFARLAIGTALQEVGTDASPELGRK